MLKDDGHAKDESVFMCDSVDQFEGMERELGIAARWTSPTPNKAGVPDWANRWKWRPGDIPAPLYGNDVYLLFFVLCLI